MVGSCDVHFPIHLEGLYLAHSQFASYEPELFPGLIYRMVQPRIVLLIFVSGKVVLTGIFTIRPLSLTGRISQVDARVPLLHAPCHLYLLAGAKHKTEIMDAFRNIYPLLKKFRKQ